uniref:Ig-like domain-containing protein n=1 Tax=Anopheles culicifacies TaxID=139723 RepID=A0A182LV60_9DIPT
MSKNFPSSVPSIVISGPSIVTEYRKVQLQCITTKEHKNLLWYFSSNEPGAQYKPLQSSSSVRLRSNGSTVDIRCVNENHVGSYRCCANGSVCNQTSLFVLSAADNHSSLRPADKPALNSGVFDVPGSGSFSLSIYHARLSEDIYITRESSVSLCDFFLTRGRECFENRSPNMVSYNVRNATMEDSGRFDIKMLVNQHWEQFHLHIMIRGIPTVHMNSYSILKNTSHINLQCHGNAYPPPNITFSYTPCNPMEMTNLNSLDRRHCGGITTLPQHLERYSLFNYTTNYEVVVPSWPIETGPGIVFCHATNSEGSTATETFLYVRNFPDPMVLSVISPTDVILYHDVVNITCQVDVYNFTNQFTIHHGGSSFDLIGQRHHYAWVGTFLVHINNASHNEVFCTAHHTNGAILMKKLELLVKYPSKPHILSTNDTVNTTIASGVHLRLECDIVGTPTPDIVWIKNDDHLRDKHGHIIGITLHRNETGATYKCLGKNRFGTAIKTWNIVKEGVVMLTLYNILRFKPMVVNNWASWWTDKWYGPTCSKQIFHGNSLLTATKPLV